MFPLSYDKNQLLANNIKLNRGFKNRQEVANITTSNHIAVSINQLTSFKLQSCLDDI